MGAVWMAEQTEPVRRLVALKIIRPDRGGDHFLARFEAKRHALAPMDHPNIAKVLDAGESPPVATGGLGTPFLAMELVKGIPITKYCDDARLTIRERVELFIPVCRAVQHAHTKGIIHRDLKPSNILVALYDAVAVPKVIDFGVAKALHQKLTDRTMVTEFGAVIGTPEYMAPEQAEFNALDIDTRADVYSLGVILYELLSGSPPFDRRKLQVAALLEILRIIKEVEPPTPSKRLSGVDTLPEVAARRKIEPQKLGRLLRGELDWGVMRAMEKERGSRYETADHFAKDLEDHLAGRCVAACAPSIIHRIRKFMCRHTKFVGVTIIALILIAAATVMTHMSAADARQSALTAKVLEEKLANAEKEKREAQRIVDALSAQLSAMAGRAEYEGRPSSEIEAELFRGRPYLMELVAKQRVIIEAEKGAFGPSSVTVRVRDTTD